MKISILTAFSLFVVIVACTPQETDVTFDAQSSEAETASSASHSPSIDEPSSTPKSTQASQSNYKEFLFNMDQPQDVNFIAVSPDGKRLAYTVPLPGKDLFLVDGELIEEFEFLGEPTFSPDSQKTAVVARFDEKAFWIVDGERGNVYDEVGYLAFSPTSNRWGHLGMDGEQTFLVIDGEEIRQHDNIQFWAFSPDSQHFAYVADEGAKQVLVVDGSE